MAVVLPVVSGAIKASAAILGSSKFFLVIPTFLAALAYFNYDIFDPENRPIIVKNISREYDFVVIGAGGAGAVIANRLTEIPNWSVLVLEAGGHETEISDVPLLSLYLHKSKLDWRYRTQPGNTACQAMEDKRCCWTRGKVLGGSTVLNTMLYIRGNRRDFDQWEALGNPGWGYKDVLPYFIKSEDQRNPYLAKNTKYHGTGGYLTVQDCPYNTPLGLAFLQAGQEMGYEVRDINGEFQTGFALYQFTMRRGTRCSTSKAFLRPIRLRQNLHVSIWTHVTKILIHPQTKRAYGVEFIRDGRKQVVYAKKEVILSAGAINSPQVLMLSGVGPARTLQKYDIPVIQDSPGVGQNLQDHIAVGGIIFLIDQPFSLVMRRLVNLNTALRYAIYENGPLTSSVGLESVGFITTKYGNQSDDWPDIEFMITSSATNSDGGDQVKKAHGLTQKFYDENYASINNLDVFGVFPMMLRPKSRGYVTIQSNDPLRYPLMYHNYLTHPDDVRVLREGVKHAIAFGQTNSMKQFGARFHQTPVYGCRHLQQFTDEYWECVIRQYTMTIYHMSGTSKMGPPSDPFAVVDHRLKVYGIKKIQLPQQSNLKLKTLLTGLLRRITLANFTDVLSSSEALDNVKAKPKLCLGFALTLSRASEEDKTSVKFASVMRRNSPLKGLGCNRSDCNVPITITDLRVIDASIMPRITSGNIQAPVIMIGEKGADFIKEDWLQNNRVKRNAYEKPTIYQNTPVKSQDKFRDVSSRDDAPIKLNCSFEEYYNNITSTLNKTYIFQKVKFEDLFTLR